MCVRTRCMSSVRVQLEVTGGTLSTADAMADAVVQPASLAGNAAPASSSGSGSFTLHGRTYIVPASGSIIKVKAPCWPKGRAFRPLKGESAADFEGRVREAEGQAVQASIERLQSPQPAPTTPTKQSRRVSSRCVTQCKARADEAVLERTPAGQERRPGTRIRAAQLSRQIGDAYADRTYRRDRGGDWQRR